MRSSFNQGLTVSCAKGRPVMLVSRSMASFLHRLFSAQKILPEIFT